MIEIFSKPANDNTFTYGGIQRELSSAVINDDRFFETVERAVSYLLPDINEMIIVNSTIQKELTDITSNYLTVRYGN